jgi:DNA processing protein
MLEVDRVSLLALCRIKGLSWYLVAREARRPDGLARLLSGELTEKSKEATAARHVLVDALPNLGPLVDEVGALLRSAFADGMRLTTVLDDDYPLNLRTIFNPPPFLFYLGELKPDDDARSVAVVGTRDASAEGLRRARNMARLLVKNGVTVLSGLALGIDGAAHQAALSAGGRAVAVLGSGLRRIYPKEHEALAREVAAHGALVSQFWPDAPPATYSFPRRNVTMSGMGQGTVVIEASSTSGAKMQARLALEHGKRVFLISSLVTDQPWAKKYVAKGAIEVHDVRDIIVKLRTAEDIRKLAEQSQQLGLGLAG